MIKNEKNILTNNEIKYIMKSQKTNGGQKNDNNQNNRTNQRSNNRNSKKYV